MRPIHIAATARALKTTHRIPTHMLKHFSCSPPPHGFPSLYLFYATTFLLLIAYPIMGFRRNKYFGKGFWSRDTHKRSFLVLSPITSMLIFGLFSKSFLFDWVENTKKKRWVKNTKMTKKWLNFILRPQTFRNSKVPPWKYNRSLRIWHREFVLQ